jgi:hypothetical protein
LEFTVKDFPTFPAPLAAETIPAPLPEKRPEPLSKGPARQSAWPGILLKLSLLALGIWLILRWR